MRLSDPDRVFLLGQITAALIPLKITNTPPAKDGTRKEASKDFATACWALRYLKSLEYVLERDEQPATSSGAAPTPSPDADVPF